ncbi:MAG: hypothetical protein ACTSPI_16610 [Candidatus Heimdallarchaeaceae archaeon]
MEESKNIVVPECPHCGGQLVQRINKAKGTKFWACPNWKPNGAGCKGFTWSPASKKKSYSSGREEVSLQTNSELTEIKDLLVEIRDLLQVKKIEE